MQIPNVIIHLRCHNGTGIGPIIAPAYTAAVLRRVFAGKLDPTAPGMGIEITPYPEDGYIETRYSDISGVEQELARLRRRYGGSNGAYFADLAWPEDTLRKEIEKLLLAEALRLREATRIKPLIAAHPSFIAFGLTEDQARALQSAGFTDRSACLDQSLIDLSSVLGITLDVAQRLSVADPKPEVKK
jgi:hypothetical protein